MSAGFGVDTTIADVRNVFSLVRAYLEKPDSSARTRGLWSIANELDRTVGDITAWQVNQGFPATVVGVIPAVPGDSIYIVRILYAQADSAGSVSPLALQRLYAVREGGAPYSFRLSGAFPRMRTEWEQRSKGPLTFWYVPGQRPNPTRINAAARFVDSVAKLFSVPVPRHLDVIVGKSMDDVQRAIGLDFFPESSGPGQRSGGLNLGFIVLSGNPAIGEAYFHEFAHSILGPSLTAGSRLLLEGVATWLGGSRGRTPREMYPCCGATALRFDAYAFAFDSIQLRGFRCRSELQPLIWKWSSDCRFHLSKGRHFRASQRYQAKGDPSH